MNYQKLSTYTIKKAVWTTVFTIYAGIVFYGSIYPVQPEATPLLTIPGADKIVHAGEFFLFTLIGSQTINYYSSRRERLKRLVSISVFYGGLTEISQMFLSYRTASVLDWLANIFGIGAGVIVILTFERWREDKKPT